MVSTESHLYGNNSLGVIFISVRGTNVYPILWGIFHPSIHPSIAEEFDRFLPPVHTRYAENIDRDYTVIRSPNHAKPRDATHAKINLENSRRNRPEYDRKLAVFHTPMFSSLHALKGERKKP